MKKTYIYLIELPTSNQVYIGKTVDPLSRIYAHRTTLSKDFQFTLIDEVKSINSQDWKSLECYWIHQFKQWGFKVLNKNQGGGGPSKKSPESIHQTVIKRQKTIYQYNLVGDLVKVWSSIKEAKKIHNCNIDGCLRGTIKIAGGYIWKYKPTLEFTQHLKPYKGKKVFQYDLNKSFIKEWDSANEAERFFTSSPNIGVDTGSPYGMNMDEFNNPVRDPDHA